MGLVGASSGASRANGGVGGVGGIVPAWCLLLDDELCFPPLLFLLCGVCGRGSIGVPLVSVSSSTTSSSSSSHGGAALGDTDRRNGNTRDFGVVVARRVVLVGCCDRAAIGRCRSVGEASAVGNSGEWCAAVGMVVGSCLSRVEGACRVVGDWACDQLSDVAPRVLGVCYLDRT